MSVRLRYLYRAYRYRFRVDPAEIRFVRQSLRRGQIAVDIGCHKGAYTYWMRRSVGPSGTVYAFEPQPRQVAYLRKAFSAMHYDNVEIVSMAVSNQCGKLPLHIAEGAGLTHAASLETKVSPPSRGGPEGAARLAALTCSQLQVDVTTLDEFCANAAKRAGANGTNRYGPSFLKIDVEGHELSVLEGARGMLEAHRPTILLECEARHRPDGDVRPVFKFLASLGYTGSFFSHGIRRPLAEFDPTVHQRIDPASDHLPPDYVNNFAFEP